jgi:general secretion pathway protein G
MPDRSNVERESERGFTLIEMMIVVAIIAILVSVLVPNFMRARAQAQTAACEANLKEIATALELYQTDHESYPNVTSETQVTSSEANLGPYIRQTPIDPVAPTGFYEYSVTNPAAGNASYTIICPGQHDPGTLTAISGTSSADHIEYSSSNGFTAVASQ